MKAVILGAGRVGLGYLGQMLGESGYRVTVVERRPEIVEALNRGSYVINTCHDDGSRVAVQVEGVRAISFSDAHTLARELAGARLVFTAVGAADLPQVSRLLARAFQCWLTLPFSNVLDVISCENMPDSATCVRRAVREVVSESEWETLQERVRFRRAMVWRIIPERSLLNGVLHMRADPAERMDVEALPSPNLLPPVRGTILRRDMGQAIRKKLYVFVTGHAVAAYLGYVGGFRCLHDALQDPSIRSIVTMALLEAGRGLLCNNGSRPDLRQLADDYTARYENLALQDSIVRVGRRPLQKLGPSERFLLPAKAALAAGVLPWGLGAGIAAALRYDHPNDVEAVQLQERIRTKGVGRALEEIAGLRQTEPLARIVLSQFAHCAGTPRVPAWSAPVSQGVSG